MTKFSKGDRVKLTTKTAKAIQTTSGRGRRINWSERLGIVQYQRIWTHVVVVKWDDRASVDDWPDTALEKC